MHYQHLLLASWQNISIHLRKLICHHIVYFECRCEISNWLKSIELIQIITHQLIDATFGMSVWKEMEKVENLKRKENVRENEKSCHFHLFKLWLHRKHGKLHVFSASCNQRQMFQFISVSLSISIAFCFLSLYFALSLHLYAIIYHDRFGLTMHKIAIKIKCSSLIAQMWTVSDKLYGNFFSIVEWLAPTHMHTHTQTSTFSHAHTHKHINPHTDNGRQANLLSIWL